MSKIRIAISLDGFTVARIDELVAAGIYPNRSRAVEAAVVEKLERLDRGRLARECGKLDRRFEKALAEENLGRWSKY